MKCYQCGKLGHPAYKFPYKPSASYGEKKITFVQEEDSSKQSEVDLEVEKGVKLMFRRVLLKEPTKEEDKKKMALFRITC